MLGSLGTLALLSSCQPPLPVILAVLDAGKIVFHARQQGFPGKIFGWDDSKYELRLLRVVRGAQVYWAIGEDDAEASGCRRATSFPLTYGAVPCGYRQLVNASALGAGQYGIYADIGDGPNSDFPDGMFIVRANGSIMNLRTD
jgi:hypothetical protein